MSEAGAKPDYELRRELSPGHYRTYATVYLRPLRVWILGRWIVGRP